MAEVLQKPILLQGDVYEVEKLVGIKIVNGKKLYRVRWQGYSAQYDTLEPEENLLSCKDMIKDIEEKLEKKRLKKLIKPARTEKDFEEMCGESEQEMKDCNLEVKSPINGKDTFWRDFDEGKINVSDQDMYSKVKERAARACFHNDAKSTDVQIKEAPLLVCPKVVLKRRTNAKNSNGCPTYKSTLQIKQVTVRVKKRKRYDVLRDYRKRRNRCVRKRNVDENKHLNRQQNSASMGSVLYQTAMKARNTALLGKTCIKQESQFTENSCSSEYSKVLQELPANDDLSSSEFTLPNSSSSKNFLKDADKPFPYHFPLKTECEEISEMSEASCKEVLKAERRNSDIKKEQNFSSLYQAINSLSVHANSDSFNFPKPNMKSENVNIPAPESHIVRLSVITSHQTEMWSSIRLKDCKFLDKLMNPDSTMKVEILNRHKFDLLMAAAVQGRLDVMEKIFLQGSISVNQVLEDGITLLMVVSQMGLHDVVQLLLKFNAHKDQQNRSGETALMLACRHRRPKVVKLLLEYGANFALANLEGINALKISNKYANKTDVSSIMIDHISRMTYEFEVKTRALIKEIADIKYALFPIQCFSLNEGPNFSINFTHDVELESPGKGRKGFLLFIANCTIKENNIHCTFNGDSSVLNVAINNMKQESFKKANNFLFKMACLRTGNNEVQIITAQHPQSELKLVVCAYRVHYHRSFYSSSSDNEFVTVVHP